MSGRTILLLVVAIAAGLVAAHFVASRGMPRYGGSDAVYYCYELQQAWVCAYARSECEARLAGEDKAGIKKRCTPYTNDPPSP